MLKSQLEPSPHETTSVFVENIFDTVKKAKAAKAAKSLAESKLMTPYQYPYDDPPPVKKKRPRKNAKKNGKVKKPLTPKKKTTTPRKPRILKDEAEKRKRASPVKSPRKYTKRVTKVPAPTDIDDEEAAFILSSISQRSFDSFYNRLNSCGSNKIHIPLDLPSLSVQNHSSESVKNQAYYVMLDHNYWIVEPPAQLAAQEVPTKAEVPVEIVQHNSNATSTETQPKNGIIYAEPPVKQEIEIKQEVPMITKNKLDPYNSNEDIKINEVNNNKVNTAEKIPEKEILEKVLCNNTSVKKRWLRQAASEIKTPPKKRKTVEPAQVETKRKMEDLPSVVNCINKPEELVQVVKNQVEVDKEQAQVKGQSPKEKTPTQKEKRLNQKEKEKDKEKEEIVEVNREPEVKMESEVKIESDQKVKEPSPLSEAIVKLEEKVQPPPEISEEEKVVQPVATPDIPEEVKIEQKDDTEKIKKDEEPSIDLSVLKPVVKPILSAPVKTEPEAVAVNEEENYDNDECDKRSWDIVMDFHRIQLRKLTKANNRYGDVVSLTTSELKKENSMMEQKFRHFDSLHNQHAPEATMHFNTTRSPFPESPFSLLRKPDFASTRNTSLSIETTNQYSIVPPAFQRSVSDISLLDTRRTRWRANEPALPSFYSNSIPSFSSLGSDNFYNTHEPYSKSNYSTYRAQKALCITSQAPDPVESLWEIPSKSEGFLVSYNNNEDNASTENAFKRAVVENIPRKNLTAIAMTKTKTAVSDPRLNPSLQHDAKKDESVTPKKKVSFHPQVSTDNRKHFASF